jgi:hypothetical protein
MGIFRKAYRLLKYRYLQCQRDIIHKSLPDRKRNAEWAKQAQIREQNPLWRRAYDEKNPVDELFTRMGYDWKTLEKL